MRLAQFPDEPGVGDALKSRAGGTRDTRRARVAPRHPHHLDAAELTPFLADAATELLTREDAASTDLGMKLAAAFKLPSTEPSAVARGKRLAARAAAALRASGRRSERARDLFAKLAKTSPDAAIRDEALAAPSPRKPPDAPPRVLALYPKLTAGQRRTALGILTAKAGRRQSRRACRHAAKSRYRRRPLDRLQAVLARRPDARRARGDLGALFRPVLTLDGSEEAWTQPQAARSTARSPSSLGAP